MSSPSPFRIIAPIELGRWWQSKAEGKDAAATFPLRSKVRRTFARIAFCARLSPSLSPCNHRLCHDENRVECQGDASGGQSYDAEPSHHAKGIKRFSDINAEHNARVGELSFTVQPQIADTAPTMSTQTMGNTVHETKMP